MSAARRKLFGELAALLEKTVLVETTDGKSFSGTLAGIDPETLSLCLADVKDKKGLVHRMFLNGSAVARISAIGKPFNLKALADRLEKVFPTLVKLYEDKGFIWVMEKIRVTEKGVVGGTGPAAERVQTVYEHFVRETKG